MQNGMKRILTMLLAIVMMTTTFAMADAYDLAITDATVDAAQAQMTVTLRVGSEVDIHKLEKEAAFSVGSTALKPVADSLQTDMAVGYILVIDRSAYYSAYLDYEDVKQAAVQIIQAIPQQNRVAIVFVDEGIECNDTFMVKAAAETTVNGSNCAGGTGSSRPPSPAMIYQGLNKALQLAAKTGNGIPEQKVIILLSDFGADDNNTTLKNSVLQQLDSGSVPLITVPFYCTNYTTYEQKRKEAMAVAERGRSELLGRASLNVELTADGSKNGAFDTGKIADVASAIRESLHFASIELDITPLYKAGAAVEVKELRISFSGDTLSTHVTINQAAIATPVAVATPTPTPDPNPIIVQFGDENATVLQLQQILTELYYYEGELNRKYDTNVQVALMAFCQDNGLEFSDALRQDVWELLQSGSAKAKTTPTPAPTATPEPTRDPNLYLVMGDQGSKVYNLQTKLMSLGYMTEDERSSVYDEETQVALYEFYEVNELELQDGVTLSVWNLLQSGNALAKPTPTPEPTATPTPVVTRDPNQKFAQGDQSADVRSLQTYLINSYYLDAKDRTGVFDQNTQWAVDTFCSVNGFATIDDGMSLAAWLALQDGTALANPTATPEPTFTPEPTRDPTMKFLLGDSNSDVITLQRKLVELFYLTEDDITAVFDQQTLIAVVTFCNINGVTSGDGLTYLAWDKLMNGTPIANPTATPAPTAVPTATPTVAPTAAPEYMAIQPGDSNEYVRKYQQKLVEMGYLTAQFTAGTYDDATQAAQDLMCEYNNLTKQVGASIDMQQFVSSSTLKNMSAMGFMDKLQVQLSRTFSVAGYEIPLWIPACVVLVVFLVGIIAILCMPGKKRKGAKQSGTAPQQKPAEQAALVSSDNPTDAIDTSSDVPTSENVNDWQVVLTISYMGSASDHNYILNDGIPIYIGRGSGSDVLLNANDTQASRKHGTLVYRGNQLYYSDTSKKGSIVDGEVINNAERAVRTGSIIEISHHTIRISS